MKTAATQVHTSYKGAEDMWVQLSIDLGWGVLMALASGFFYMWASDKSVTKLPEISSIARSTITFTGAAVFTSFSFLCSF